MSYLGVFLLAAVLALTLTPAAGRLGLRWGIVARPGGRRQHTGEVSKLGGVAVAAAYFAAVILAYRLLPPIGDDIRRLRGVLLGSGIVFLGGWLDDRYDLSPWAQFAIQAAAALAAMSHLIFIGVFTNPIGGQIVQLEHRWPWLAYGVTLVWVMGIMNAVNWLDGVDGLAAGVGAIAMCMFAWHSHNLGQTTVAAFPLALAGALLGFLPFNFAPARIFLGSAGAYVLGYNLAALSILSPAKIATTLLVLALPLLDGAWRVIDRLRHRQNPLQGDRGHLHFRLLDRGWPIWRIVLSYYGVALTFGLIAIFAPSALSKLVVLGVMGAAILAGLIWQSRH